MKKKTKKLVLIRLIKTFWDFLNNGHARCTQVYCYLNLLTAKYEISHLENLIFSWTWILRWVPKSSATHASCNTLSSNKMFKNSENPGS